MFANSKGRKYFYKSELQNSIIGFYACARLAGDKRTLPPEPRRRCKTLSK